MNDLKETQDRIEFEGVVTPPPNLESILLLIELGAETKAGVNLTAGEARVLHNHLKGD